MLRHLLAMVDGPAPGQIWRSRQGRIRVLSRQPIQDEFHYVLERDGRTWIEDWHTWEVARRLERRQLI